MANCDKCIFGEFERGIGYTCSESYDVTVETCDHFDDDPIELIRLDDDDDESTLTSEDFHNFTGDGND